ncbi:MAG: hypothetical protein Q9222_006398, partial [Ikaeria aurantiellina]
MDFKQGDGEELQNYPYAYLITAPRFLGYSFNPVSFWYLYSPNKELSAMILEVNNTFDERRMYFLKTSPPDSQNGTTSPPTGKDSSANKFKTAWPKDFHVSPFNSRKGSYALIAHDPFAPLLSGAGAVDNTITLSSSKSHAKLVARIFSTDSSIDPSTLDFWAQLRFIAAWWWVGFVTFPRIVREAGKLFFRRKLHVWYRPEVLKESIGRRATADEIAIEQTFRPFLHSLVSSPSSPLTRPLKYTTSSSIPGSPSSSIFSPPPHNPHPNHSDQNDPTDLKITTPPFYSRLARYTHITEFLSSELLADDDKDRTFHISDPQALLQLLSSGGEGEPKESSILATLPTIDRLRWQFLYFLRTHRYRRHRHHISKSQHQEEDIRHLGFSALDIFAMRSQNGGK